MLVDLAGQPDSALNLKAVVETAVAQVPKTALDYDCGLEAAAAAAAAGPMRAEAASYWRPLLLRH